MFIPISKEEAMDMKKISYLFVMIAALFCSGLSAQDKAYIERTIGEGWTFNELGMKDIYHATVPGTIHSDLLDNRLIEAPFVGKNEESLRRLENKDWQYQTEFEVTAEELQHDAARIEFLGLDTYADVYLNGSHIISADNMFVAHGADVKDVLRAGTNKLVVVLYSPIKKTAPQWESNGFDYPADNDRSERHQSVFTRKAPYQYGWDWGMRLVGCGIWRPVKLTFFDTVRVSDWFVEQKSVSKAAAVVNNEITVDAVCDGKVYVNVDFRLNGETVSNASGMCTLQQGANIIALPATVASPQLWMPAGWGDPVLYDALLTITTPDGARVLAEKKERIGFRTVELVREDDQWGRSFYFKVNGIPLFAKGANYIPNDIIPTDFKKADYEKLFRDIKAANMNMIRCWGGAFYEEPEFYELADENGILIWQDFMFACSTYPSDHYFLENVKQEAEYNIRRLRNHACLALWCGNNEVEEGINYWGWKKRYTPEVFEGMKQGYDRLFNELLPECVQRLDAQHQYIHTSPVTAHWSNKAMLPYGDSHYWGIWYGKDPFEVMDTLKSRFVSEFGFESFPEMKTIMTFATEGDLHIDSDVMKHRQKSSRGNDLIKTYMGWYYNVPADFDNFIYVGQVLQGAGMRRAIEANRRNRPLCMGSLYWQLNDSWPAVSWSGIDYYRNWKALHYQAGRAFEPVITSVYEHDGMVDFYAISDRLSDIQGAVLKYEVVTFDGVLMKKGEQKVDVAANSSVKVYSQPRSFFTDEDMAHRSFMKVTLTDSRGVVLNERLHYFFYEKDLELPQVEISTDVSVSDGQYEITLRAGKLAKDVFIEVPFQGAEFSDNFFDLMPGEKKTVIVRSSEIKDGRKANFKVRHLRQTY